MSVSREEEKSIEFLIERLGKLEKQVEQAHQKIEEANQKREEANQKVEELMRVVRMNKAPNANCYTYEEVADMAGCSVRKVREAESKGELACRYPNAKKRFPRAAVDSWLSSNGKMKAKSVMKIKQKRNITL